MQQLSIFKLKFSESKNRKIIRNESKYSTLKSKEIIIGKDSSISDIYGSDYSFSIKTSSINRDIEPVESFSYADPIIYLKKLDSIINKVIN